MQGEPHQHDGHRKLHLVDTSTGEAEAVCASCVALERELRVKRGMITRLKNENRQLAGVEPDHDDIQKVLLYWRELLKPRATIVVNSDNWKAVRARLHDTDLVTNRPAFTVLHLKGAIVGLLFDEWHMDPSHRYRRDPAIAFSNADRVVRLLGRAVWFRRRHGVSALELVDDMGGDALRWLAERCSCEHTRAQHLLTGTFTPDGRLPCCCEGCGCPNFDEMAAEVDRWLTAQDKDEVVA